MTYGGQLPRPQRIVVYDFTSTSGDVHLQSGLLGLLADLARSGTRSTIPAAIDADVDSWRRRISQKVQEIQGHIESSKFEPGGVEVSQIQKLTADAQTVFILLLSLARQSRDIAQSNMVRATANELDSAIATTLETLATRGRWRLELPIPPLEDRLNIFERAMTSTDALDQEAAAHFAERLALYRALVAAIERLSSESLNTGQDERREPLDRRIFLTHEKLESTKT